MFPIILLLGTLISNFININYVILGNAIGYSILTNIFMFFHFNYFGDYCKMTKTLPIALLLINLLDVVGEWLVINEYVGYSIYSNIFNVFVCSITLIFFMYSKIKKIK